ncbi:MAG: glucosamine-6-phosphate deaminase [Butyrivibrio sp.]|nr:glucosamine-6-phosphate deaminase [Butyrivibrio sp.]
MRIIKVRDYQDMSRKAANVLSAQIILKPNCVLGLATGSTPIGLYDQLVDWYGKGDLDFALVKTVNLDEYVGLPAYNDQSYRYFMEKHLYSRVNLDPQNVNIPNGMNADPAAECLRYERVINDLGGIDLQLLGIGNNGHIGFNEPDNLFYRKTHVVDLTESTIEANKRFFEDVSMVPRQAITMGIGTIMQAKKIVMIANGEGKASIIREAFSKEINPLIPASILQLHPDFTLIADDAALSLMDI